MNNNYATIQSNNLNLDDNDSESYRKSFIKCYT